MVTVKVIQSDTNTVTFGYPDGTFEQMNRAEMDANVLFKDGDEVDIYTQPGKKDMYILHEDHNDDSRGFYAFFKNLYPDKRVKKIPYILLALFLGGIGVHQFYCGRTRMGLVYLLACWSGIPSMVALVEAIIAITRHADKDGFVII